MMQKSGMRLAWRLLMLVGCLAAMCADPSAIIYAQNKATEVAAPAGNAKAAEPGKVEAEKVVAATEPVVVPESKNTAQPNQFFVFFWWLVSLGGSICALWYAYVFYTWLMQADPGNEKMQEIAGYVREGAYAYLWQQYKVVGIFFAVIAVLLTVMAFGFDAQSRWVPVAFLTGGLFSGLAGYVGMKTATAANCRTAAAAQKSLNAGLQVAFRSGAVMGLTVVGLGLFDICLWFAVLYWLVPVFGFESMTLETITVTMLCFGMGASSQALFARVGGGIFTKAADVGADLVGKVEHGIPEDDPRNPAVIADNVGDNVGDVAGMGADLYESYCGSVLAAAALGVAAFPGQPSLQVQSILLPMALAGAGTLVSVLGIYAVRTEENATQRTLLAALAKGINISAVLIIALTFVLVPLLLPIKYFGLAFSVIVGLIAGWLIGKWTEFSTSQEFAPTRRIAEQAVTGPATVIIAGIAEGMYSTYVPVLVVGSAILAAFGFANGWDFQDPNSFAMGLYGVGISAVGMLSTLGITLATDAYGPIADNAGGNAQMAGLDPEVRERTDALDSLGNTTAATGKGFAIGSAALTALALLAAYVEEVRIGFHRWGQAVAENVEGTPEQYLTIDGKRTKLVAGDFVKLARGVVVKLGDQPKTNVTMMVLDERSIPGFSQLKNHTHLKEKFEATALIEDGRLVPVESARLADFSRFYDLTLMNPKVIVGLFIGAMLTFLFCALTMKAVGRAAFEMVKEVRRQFHEKPGIMNGTDRPDYAACVEISTKAAQLEMVIPSLIGLVSPLAVGMLLGVTGVMGLQAGALSAGFVLAVMMANAGGAWDNAKKYIEGGALGGKGSDSHKAAVVGDTVGDPFKDTSGPSLNILIKLMSMVSVVFAGVVVRFSLQALGVF